MNNLYDYFNSINDKNKISHSFLIGNVNFDAVKNDLYKIISDFIFKKDVDENGSPDVYIIRPKKGIIPKDDIKDLISEISTTSQFYNNKVYIIDGAEKLNDYSYNAILKTLEEPKDNIYAICFCFILPSLLYSITQKKKAISYFLYFIIIKLLQLLLRSYHQLRIFLQELQQHHHQVVHSLA